MGDDEGILGVRYRKELTRYNVYLIITAPGMERPRSYRTDVFAGTHTEAFDTAEALAKVHIADAKVLLRTSAEKVPQYGEKYDEVTPSAEVFMEIRDEVLNRASAEEVTEGMNGEEMMKKAKRIKAYARIIAMLEFAFPEEA